MKCEKCGKSIPENLSYCPSCKINEEKIKTIQSNNQTSNLTFQEEIINPIISEIMQEDSVKKEDKTTIDRKDKKTLGTKLQIIGMVLLFVSMGVLCIFWHGEIINQINRYIPIVIIIFVIFGICMILNFLGIIISLKEVKETGEQKKRFWLKVRLLGWCLCISGILFIFLGDLIFLFSILFFGGIFLYIISFLFYDKKTSLMKRILLFSVIFIAIYYIGNQIYNGYWQHQMKNCTEALNCLCPSVSDDSLKVIFPIIAFLLTLGVNLFNKKRSLNLHEVMGVAIIFYLVFVMFNSYIIAKSNIQRNSICAQTIKCSCSENDNLCKCDAYHYWEGIPCKKQITCPNQ